jgi:hypothetical protein
VKHPGVLSVATSARRLDHSDRFAPARRRWRRAVEFAALVTDPWVA